MGKRHIPHKQRMELLDTYEKSNVTVKAYAAENGIGYSTFQRWLRDRKTAFNATDDVHTFNTPPFQTSDQLNAGQLLQCHDQSDAPTHFVDITSYMIHTIPKVEEANEKTYLRETNDDISAPASAHTAEISNQTTPSAQNSPLDIFLPNGIRMTFHQASLDTSIALIKSLV